MNTSNVLLDMVGPKIGVDSRAKLDFSNNRRDFTCIFEQIIDRSREAYQENSKMNEKQNSVTGDYNKARSTGQVDRKEYSRSRQVARGEYGRSNQPARKRHDRVDREGNNTRDINAEDIKQRRNFADNKVEQGSSHKEDDMVTALACAMGMQSEALRALLSELDITPTDIMHSDNIDISAEKIAANLNLTPDEKDVVIQLMQKVSIQEFNQLSEEIKSLVQNSSNAENMFEQVQLLAEETISMDKAITTASTEGAGFELEIVGGKDGENLEDVLGSIREKALLYIANNKISTKSDSNAVSQNMSKYDEMLENGEQSAATLAGEEASDLGALQQNIDLNVANPEIFENHLVESKTQDIKQQAVTKSELIEQIVEKAKVTLTPEKSEMIVDLKPDTLGKLTLKIITERDAVMAKFTAENQQVKEILESNMDLLKDSLERQGFNVQGFSVSVGKDSSQNSDDSKRAGIASFKTKHRRTISAIETEQYVPSTPDLTNYYSWTNSTIDYTA